MSEKLKIGLMLDSTNVPHWVHLMVEKINQSNYAKIELVIINGSKISKNTMVNQLYLLYRQICFLLYKY